MALRDLFFNIFARDRTGPAFDTVDRRLQRTGRKIRNFGLGAAAAFALPAAGLAQSIQVAGNFEAAMNRVQIQTKANAKEFKDLRDIAKDLGSTTSFSATQAALGIEILAKNGLKASQILGGALTTSLTLAAASGSDLAASGDLVTDVMLNFNKKATELQNVANGVLGVVANSKFGFDDYRLALAQAGGVAGGLGVTLRDFNAVIAVTSSRFSSGSDAGTAFKTFLQRLTPESKAAKKIMNELGLEFFTASGQMKSMAEIATELKRGFAGLNDEAKIEALKRLFGTDAIRTAIGLMDAGAEGIMKMDKAIAQANASEHAAARMKGFNGAMKELKSAWEGLQIAIGESGVLEAITDFVKLLTQGVRWLSELDPRILKFSSLLVGIGVVVAPVVAAIGAFVFVIGLIGAKVAIAIAAITAITAAIVTFWPTIKKAALAVYDFVTNVDVYLANIFDKAWDRTLGRLGISQEKVGAILSTFVKIHVTAFTKVRDFIGEAIDAISKFLTETLPKAFDFAAEKITKMVDEVGKILMEKLGAILDFVIKKVGDVGKAFFDLWDAVVGNSYVPDMVDGIKAEFGRLPSVMVKPTENTTDRVGGLFKSLGDEVGDRFTRMFTEGTSAWEGFGQSLLDIANRFVDDIISQSFDRLISEATSALDIAGKASTSIASTGGGGGGFGGLISAAGSALGSFIGSFNDGGHFKIGGRGGVDRNLVSMNLSKDETVKITPKSQQSMGGGDRAPVVVHIHTPDVHSFQSSQSLVAAQIGAAVDQANRYSR